jgi:uncharacterized membrane protein YjjP (DUF1212 family)
MPPPENQASSPGAIEFVMRLGEALHRYGVPAYRLEAALGRMAARLGLKAQIFTTPTALIASFTGEPGSAPRTEMIRVEPGDVDLGRMAQLDRVARRVVDSRMTLGEGKENLEEILAAPARYGAALTALCYALSSGCAARFFGGGVNEIGAAAGIGLLIGVLMPLGARHPAFGQISAAVAAFLAAALAAVAGLYLPLSAQTVLIAALIALIPGLTLTVALNELATNHLASGTARLAGAAVTFLQLGFGAALGGRLGAALPGALAGAPPAALPVWTLGIALLIAPLALVVLFRAAFGDAPAIVAASILGFAGARLGAQWLGPELGVFLGASALGLAGNLYARIGRRPGAILIVPGLMLLVPGSLGVRSFESLLGKEVISGVATAFTMTLIAISLVAGLLFANAVAQLLLPERKAL